RQVARELSLQKQADWSFRGRAAISDGQQAGTVKMLWRQHGESFDIEISLPVTNQKYRLRNSGGKVRLESYGLQTIEGDSAEAVLMQVTGWRIPFRDMQLWLRGIRTDATTQIEFNPAGLPAKFRENGWLVDYRAWNSAATPMPTKVFASTGGNGVNASVRLQIETWDSP
ncbi:MAG: lipoprotein insertase outer membrane protein LolB, partial [Arenimonas sp.]